MASITKWTQVGVAMQSVIAATKTISAITQANPGVATSTAHGYTNGQYVLILAQGMYQLNNRVFRVANVTANTFELEGEDTTSYPAFSTGTAQLLTLGNTFSTITDADGSGGEAEQLDATTIHDPLRVIVPGLPTAMVYNMQSIWDPSDAALKALRLASNSASDRVFQFTFQNGRIMVFNGLVSAPGNPTGSAGQIVKTPIQITARALPTYY